MSFEKTNESEGFACDALLTVQEVAQLPRYQSPGFTKELA